MKSLKILVILMCGLSISKTVANADVIYSPLELTPIEKSGVQFVPVLPVLKYLDAFVSIQKGVIHAVIPYGRDGFRVKIAETKASIFVEGSWSHVTLEKPLFVGNGVTFMPVSLIDKIFDKRIVTSVSYRPARKVKRKSTKKESVVRIKRRDSRRDKSNRKRNYRAPDPPPI